MNYKDNFQRIINCIPLSENTTVDWAALEATELRDVFDSMKNTMQNLEYHGEGDVYSHTKSVCDALVLEKDYIESNNEDKIVLFLSALLHDIGKIRCTKLIDGKLSSPYHSSVGAVMARKLLWQDFELCGTYDNQQLRESICALIRYHSFPTFSSIAENAELRILKIAATGELAKYFSVRKLCLLEKADILGRISQRREEFLDRVYFCEMLAEEIGCADKPYSFADKYSQRAFFTEKTSWRDHKLYNDTWGEVILMCGLPGTGKDTWISKNHPDMPVISLDEIRKELGVSPTDNQSVVITHAKERARVLLRQKKPFVWNATSLTAQLRANQISLFEQYGASVKTVFLETRWDEELRRNSERKSAVPVSVIEKMLSKFEIPERFECEQIEWITV